MQNLTKGPRDTLVLSRGKLWQGKYTQRTAFPGGTEAQVEIYDTAGALLYTSYGTVNGGEISFVEYPDDFNSIPQGSLFEFSISDPATGEFELKSNGEVIREEAKFPFAAPTIVDDPLRQFSDTFSSVVSQRWVRIGGNSGLTIHDNGSDPNSMGPNYSFVNQAAALWYAPMSMDSVTVTVSLVQVNPFIEVGYGQLNVVVCSDSSMKYYMGMQFQAGNTNGGNLIQPITGNGSAFSWDNRGTPLSHTATTADVYTVRYSYLSNTLSVYLNDDLTPLLSWTDSSNVVSHGSEAYRYVGLAFNSSLFAPSVEPTAWEVHDGL